MTEEECGRVSHAAAWVLGTLSADDADRDETEAGEPAEHERAQPLSATGGLW